MPVITAGRFAAATSVLALVVAMGGTGYAAIKIGGNQIKKNAITSKHVKNNSLTGKDIKESSLAKVPSAANADSAGKVNGVTPVEVFFDNGPTANVPIFTGGGLTIRGACTAGDLSLTGTTSKTNSTIGSSLVDLEGDVLVGEDLEGGLFDTGVTFDFLAGASVTEEDPSLTSFVYTAPDHTVITGKFYTDHSNAGPTTCQVIGHVFVS